MSAKLETALAMKQVLVQKKVSGEVVITFYNSDINPVVLSHRGIVDILSKRGVTTEAIRNSNLKDLIKQRFVEVK